MSDILITGQVVKDAVENGYSVAAPEGYTESARPFRPVRCNQSDIDDKLDPVNGYVYFTLDTQKIFYGTGSEFLPMGGSSGIYYTNKTFGEDASDDTSFSLEHFVDGKLPTNINDLIINVGKNEARNGFYKVIRIDEDQNLVETSYLPVGGGGGGGGTGTIGGELLIEWVYPSSGSDSILANENYVLQFNVWAYDKAGDLVPGTGVATWKRGSTKIATTNVINGLNTFDVSQYLSPTLNDGNNNISVSISMNTGGSVNDTATKQWSIKVINLALDWKHEYSPLNYFNSNTFTVYYTPKGNVDATAFIWFDDNDFNVKTATIKANQMGQQRPFTADSLDYGAHSMHMRLGTKISETEWKYTDTITHELTFTKGGTKPILTVPFYDLSATQYDTINIPFLIYDPDKAEVEVEFRVNGAPVSTDTYNRELQHIPYTFGTSGNLTLSLTSANADPWEYEIAVAPLSLDVEEVEGAVFSLPASRYSGKEELLKLAEKGLIEFSDNFDWINGGLKTETDEKGNLRKYICVKNGTYMKINYKPFEQNALQSGKSIKFVFKAANCYDYNASVMSCSESSCSLQVNAQNALFSCTGVAPLNTYYCENSYIELELDIWKRDSSYSETNPPDNFIMYWVDGVPANVRPYDPSISEIRQTVAKPITIGSTDCDVYVYLVKIYEKYLSENEHLNSFILDAPNTEEMLARYERNNILDASGNISYSKLVEKNPNCNAFLYRIDRMTKDKNDKIGGCNYQRYHSNPKEPDETADNVEIRVQGTSSAAYGVAAYNIDAKFKNGFYDTKTGKTSSGWSMSNTAIPVNYFCTKVNVASCENANNALNQEWYNRFQPYWDAHRRKKRDDNKIARDCMEFIPGVMFIRDDNNVIDAQYNNEKNIYWDNENYMALAPEDRPYLQYAICNMGNSKKNVEVFHSDLKDFPNACCVEVTDNNNDQHKMKLVVDESAFDEWIDEEGKVQKPFYEFRYPDEDDFNYSPMKQKFLRLVNWMATNNPNAATDEDLPAPETYGAYTFKGFNPPGYTASSGSGITLAGTTESTYANTYTKDTYKRRMAKMLQECENYLVMDSIVYHYLFIERHTMVDNVAKNTFWSTEDGEHWDLTKNYDNDTADGNDNSGNLDFYYGLEVGDVTESGEQVFNGPGSVWIEFIKGLPMAREKLYIQLATAGAWQTNTYLNLFNEFQSAIPERCWIYDYFKKYIRPRRLGLDEDTYLKRLEGGKKTHQRKQYETYNGIYQNSKYKTGISSNYIDLRLAAGELSETDTVPVSFYIDCYVYAKIGGQDFHKRNKRGQICHMPVGKMITSADDATCYIYYEDMVQTLKDLAPLYPTYFQGGNAKRLRDIAIGSDASGYHNTYIDTLGFSQNTMLESIDVQNIGIEDNLSTLGLENLSSLKEIYMTGSGFVGVAFADAGLLQTAYINDVSLLKMSNLDKLEDLVIQRDRNNSQRYKITELNINKCPSVDTYDLVKHSDALNRYYLTEVNWTVTDINDISQVSGFLTGVNVLDHLLRKDEEGNDLCLPVAGYTTQTALTGTLTIDVSGVSINEYEIYKKYNKKFPNLTIQYGSHALPNLNKASKIIFYESDEENADELFSVLTDGTMTLDVLTGGGENSPTSLKLGIPVKNQTVQNTYYWNLNENDIDDLDWTIVSPPAGWETDFTHVDLLTKTPPATINNAPYTMHIRPKFTSKTRKYKVVLKDHNNTDIDAGFDIDGVEYNTVIQLPTYIYREHSQDMYRWTFRGWISTTDYLSGNKNPQLIADLTNNTKTITEDFYAYAYYTEDNVLEVPSPIEYFDISSFASSYGSYGTGHDISLKAKYKDIIQGKLTLPAQYNGNNIICIRDFADMKKVTHIYFEKGSIYTMVGQVDVISGAFQRTSQYEPTLIEVNLPASIKFIGARSFYNQCKLQTVNLDNLTSLEYIGQAAFEHNILWYDDPASIIHCSKLSNTLTQIAANAFYNAGPNITLENLPENLLMLGDWAFYNCTGLKITSFGSDITPGLSYIGQGVFSMSAASGGTSVNGTIEIKKSVIGIYQGGSNYYVDMPFANYGTNIVAKLSYPASQYYANSLLTVTGITPAGTGVTAFSEPPKEELS